MTGENILPSIHDCRPIETSTTVTESSPADEIRACLGNRVVHEACDAYASSNFFSAQSAATDSLVFRGRLEKLEVLHRWSGRTAPIIDEAGRQRVVPALSLVIYK